MADCIKKVPDWTHFNLPKVFKYQNKMIYWNIKLGTTKFESKDKNALRSITDKDSTSIHLIITVWERERSQFVIPKFPFKITSSFVLFV